MINSFRNNLRLLKEKNPLILNITNVVVTNITANALLAIGASPVMAYEKDEIKDMTAISNALVINIGTLTREFMETSFTAIETANRLSIPVIFDPVGVGATAYRNEAAKEILNNFKINAIRGNASEIANLSGYSAKTKGVDSAEDNILQIKELSCLLSQKHNCIVCASGKEDIITDSKTTYGVKNGNIMLTKITGSGCISTSVMGAFMAVGNNFLTACTAAATMVGISGEIASKNAKGLGHFQIEFFDNLSLFNENSFESAKVNLL